MLFSHFLLFQKLFSSQLVSLAWKVKAKNYCKATKIIPSTFYFRWSYWLHLTWHYKCLCFSVTKWFLTRPVLSSSMSSAVRSPSLYSAVGTSRRNAQLLSCRLLWRDGWTRKLCDCTNISSKLVSMINTWGAKEIWLHSSPSKILIKQLLPIYILT